MKDHEDTVTTNQKQIVQIIKNFHLKLYSKQIPKPYQQMLMIMNVGQEEEVPEMSQKIRVALKQMKKEKYPGEDSIYTEM